MAELQAQSTEQPSGTHLRVTTGAGDLTDDERGELAVDLQSAWIASSSARAAMDENLKAFAALYEMEVDQLDWPWENAANLCLPIIPSELEAMKAYVSSQVFVQRLVIVTAADNDPETQRLAPVVEKFYNAELCRIRSDGKTPLDQLKLILHRGLRDGSAPCDVLFTERKEPVMLLSEEPKIVDDNVVLNEDGEIERERVTTTVEETVAEVNIIPHLLKEWYLAPDESTSIQSASGNFSVQWMDETAMNEKVKAGLFRLQDVEEVLNFVVAGQTDVATDPQGHYDKDAGGQISIGQGKGALVSKFFKNRGPARVLRYFSSDFDMNGDGIAEKNVFWFYPDIPKLLGWAPYEYVVREWPTFMFTPFPRPDSAYGFSLCERLADIVADANAGRNQRRNYIDLILMPLLLQREGDTIRDKDRAFYPGAQWTVEDVNASMKWFTPPPLTPEVFADESRLDVYTSRVTGQNAPALGTQSSGRRTATEMRQQQMATSVRTADVAMEFRAFLRAVVQFWHKLNKQYLGTTGSKALSSYVSPDLAKQYGTNEQPGQVTLTADILQRKFNIDIAGLSDPVDGPSRRQEILASLGIIAKVFPWILQDPVKAYELAATFFETFQWAGVERFIGTREEAMGRGQAAQAQAEGQQKAAAVQQATATAQQRQQQGGGQGQPPQALPPNAGAGGKQ